MVIAETRRDTGIAPQKEMRPEEIIRIAAEDYARISAITAIGGVIHVDNQHNALGGRLPTEDEIKTIGKGMDHATIPIAERAFRTSRLRNIIIASEGKKDDTPFLKGELGASNGPIIEVIHDAIDGTTLIAGKRKGAVSLISGSKKFGMIPPEYDYMVSITVPKKARKAISSLSLTKEGHKQTLLNISEELEITTDKLTQIVLNPSKKGREINGMFLEAGDELRIKRRLIDAGDFMSRLFCSLSREERLDYCERYHLDPEEFGGHMIMVGRGGAPELSAATAVGRITGAPTLAYIWKPDIEKIDTQNVFTTEILVPGDRESTIVVATFATACPWLKQPGVQIDSDGNYIVRTMVLTARKGLEIVTNTYSPRDLN